jgi:hypothetical protein
MNITKYNHLSNRELLAQVESVRDYSPVIEELCQRLENVGGECPVCEADLTRANKELE